MKKLYKLALSSRIKHEEHHQAQGEDFSNIQQRGDEDFPTTTVGSGREMGESPPFGLRTGSAECSTQRILPSPIANSRRAQSNSLDMNDVTENNLGPEEISALANQLQSCEFLQVHTPEDLEMFAKVMEPVEVKPGDYVYKEGDVSDALYVVEGGQFLMKCRESAHKVFKGAGSFGGAGLRYRTKRNHSILSETGGKLWKLRASVYQSRIVHQQKVEATQYVSFLRRVPILSELTDEQLFALSRCLRRETFKDGTKIITQGQVGSTFFFILSGNVVCNQRTMKGTKEIVTQVNKYSEGDYFGEGALIQDAPRNADVVAVGNVVCLTLCREDFDDMLGGLAQVLEGNFRARVLKGVDLLSNLTDAERYEIADALILESFENGEYIIRQGDHGDKFYIIKEGEVLFTRTESPEDKKAVAEAAAAASAAAAAELLTETNGKTSHQTSGAQDSDVTMTDSGRRGYSDSLSSDSSMGSKPEKPKEIGRLFLGQYFGEGALLTDAPRRANAVAVGHVKLLSLERSVFSKVFNQTLQDMLNRDFTKRRDLDVGRSELMEFGDLQQIRVLGAGTYGQVILVTHTVTGKTFALKCMKKSRIVDLEQQEHVKNEKRILAMINHPFVVNMIQSFVGPGYVYALLEAVLGGELFALMRKVGRIKLKPALFYIAQVVLVFEYLHSHNIIYRDLKPENLLLSASGYLKVTDFGLAKALTDETKTYTLCGTPAYAAPEVYNLSGHGKPVDWWTLGVFTHELLSSMTPFDGTVEDIFASLGQYARAYPNIRLPRGISGDAGHFVLRLLNPNPNKRLGCLPSGGGAREVKSHQLFKGFSWSSLIKGKMESPYKPKINSLYDTQNFYEPAVNDQSKINIEDVDLNLVEANKSWDL